MHNCVRLARPWSGTIFRFVTVRYASRADLLSGRGSRRFGGRWNPPSLFNCIYGSLEPRTAISEALGTTSAFGIPPSQTRPRVFVAVDLRLQVVLDLRNPQVLRRLGVLDRELLAADWLASQDAGEESLTQAIGRIAWEEKLEGILVPSTREPDGTNLALFPGRRRRGSSWRIQGARDLP
jgi:RES domain-containing protein